MNGWLKDLQFALRALSRAPGFAATVILTLAIGVGSASAIFSLVDGILLRPLDFPEEERIVVVWQDWTRRGGPEREWFSYQNFADLRDEEGLFEEAAVYLERAALGLPQRPRISYNLGLLQLYLKQIPEAESSLRRALEAEPENVDFLFGLADFSIKQGRFDEAEALAGRMLAVDPGNETGRQILRFIEQVRQR